MLISPYSFFHENIIHGKQTLLHAFHTGDIYGCYAINYFFHLLMSTLINMSFYTTSYRENFT